MNVSFTIEGLIALSKQTAEVRAKVAREIDVALFAAAKQVEGEAKRSIAAGGKTGRVYKRRSVTHQASAPGEAPATDTGRLVNSVTAYPPSNGESSVVAGRGTVGHAAHLEFGTRNMAARPFLFPALEKSKKWIADRLTKAVQKGIEKGSN